MNITPKSKSNIGEIILRSLVVGLVYALVAAILGSMSRLTPSLDNILVWLITGTLVCLSLSPFILHTNGSRMKTPFAVWAVQAFVRSLGLGIEGSLFKPTAALMFRMATAKFEGRGGPSLMMVAGPIDEWDAEMVENFISSIQ
jgi:hypothetical protein